MSLVPVLILLLANGLDSRSYGTNFLRRSGPIFLQSYHSVNFHIQGKCVLFQIPMSLTFQEQLQAMEVQVKGDL